jgi:ArsR family transcriptional regulator
VKVAKAVGDQLRSNVLRVLAQDSFGVLELCAIFDMAQPALSHHLKILSEANLVEKRRESTNVFYHRARPKSDALLSAMFSAIDGDRVTPGIQKQIEKVYARRAKRSEQFFATHAEALQTQNELICPSDVYIPSLVEAICTSGRPQINALEIGPGSGALMLELAHHFQRVVGIDSSEKMLAMTAATVANQENIQLLQRDFFALPRIRKYDALVAAMVIHHMASPKQFFAQATEVMKPGGTLVIAELWVKEMCGDLWLGFETDVLAGWAREAGFSAAQQQFLALRNGFRVQIINYTLHS